MASFSDASPANVGDYRVRIKWGDRSQPSSAQVSCVPNETAPEPNSPAVPVGKAAPTYAMCIKYEVVASHSYTTPGPYVVRTTVSRPGASAATFTGSVTAGRYVALGDSYSSGEGAPTNSFPGQQYIAPTDGGGPKGQDVCHRSVQSWTELVASDFGYNHSGSFNFLACSGSTTNQMDATGADAAAANYGEGSQVARIGSGAGLVTLTAGGDDLGFSTVLKTCILAAVVGPVSDCSPKSSTAQMIHRGLATLSNSIARLASAIREHAPHARIVLVGYPEIFPQSPSGCVYNFSGNLLTAPIAGLLRTILGSGGSSAPVPSSLTYLTASEESWLNGVERTFNTDLKTDASQSDMEFVAVQNAFSGHELCSGSPDDINGPQIHTQTLNYLYNYVKARQAPSGELPIQQESFHPTPAGYSSMAGDVESYLRQPWSPSSTQIRSAPLTTSCGVSQLTSTVISYVSQNTPWNPSEYTVSEVKIAGSNPVWAGFSVTANPGASDVQGGGGVAECTTSWQVKSLGGLTWGCAAPPSLRSQLGFPSEAATQCPVSVATYETGQPEAGYSTYDLFSGSCSTFVATYRYSFMDITSGPSSVSIPADRAVELVGGGTSSRSSSEAVSGPLPGGVPKPGPNQAGVLRDDRYSLVSYRCAAPAPGAPTAGEPRTTTPTAAVTPGHGSPEAAVAGFYSDAIVGNNTGVCGFLIPSAQATCKAFASSETPTTGSFSIAGQSVSGAGALVPHQATFARLTSSRRTLS